MKREKPTRPARAKRPDPAKALHEQQRAEAAVRRGQALALRIKGLGYAAIGQALEISTGQAYEDVREALAETKAVNDAKAEELRALECARYDLATAKLVEKIETTGSLNAVDRLVKLSESRRRLLGLDAPTKIAATDPTGEREATSDRQRATVARMLEKLQTEKGLTRDEAATALRSLGVPDELLSL